MEYICLDMTDDKEEIIPIYSLRVFKEVNGHIIDSVLYLEKETLRYYTNDISTGHPLTFRKREDAERTASEIHEEAGVDFLEVWPGMALL